MERMRNKRNKKKIGMKTGKNIKSGKKVGREEGTQE